MPSKKEKRTHEFLGDDCGQNALQLAARGTALIAEILRLCEHIPSVFLHPEKQQQYQHIICDFSYFERQDDFEKRIQNSVELLERDDEFRETHIELLERFFKLFRGVYGYATELNRFVAEIKEGLYISQSMESILVNADGKQLLCEVFYLFGVMLLLFDVKMGGKVREYLIVSYARYKGVSDQHTVDICAMCRATGFEVGKPLPDRYPERYFARVKLDYDVIDLLIGRVRSDDLYQMAYHYPAPEHRSTALATQAAMLYVLLLFRTQVLHEERQVMREIVDKHFVDNWVIAFYMGFTVDLAVAWKPFKAAATAITGTLSDDNVVYHLKRAQKNIEKLKPEVAGLLREGVLTEQYVLDNVHASLLPTIRQANVTMRWCVLHMTRGPVDRAIPAHHKKVYEAIMNGVPVDDVLTLLLGISQLEFTLRGMFEQLLKQKRKKWEEAKEQTATKMTRLSQYFSGEHVLSDGVRVAQLEAWFNDIADRIEGLSYADSTTAGRKIQKLMKALENVQEFHHIDANLHVVQFLRESTQLLRQMIRYINIERKVLITISTIGDLSYAWELMAKHGCFVNEIQAKIKQKPLLVLQMRSAFVKMATMLEMPCTRIAQAADNDPSLAGTLESVSEYYSSELVVFVRRVLHVIPSSIFHVLREIMGVLVQDLVSCPTKLAKKDLKEQSQLNTRLRLSRLTSSVSQFASGILAMESTLVGVIQVDPHQLLEDGIRKELVERLTNELDRNVVFDPKKPLSAEEFDAMLRGLGRQLQGMRNAFEYIQDYVNVHGLRVWLEEFSRIVNFNVDMECNAFMQKQLYHWKSRYQSDRIPIPYLRDPPPEESYSFLGRLAQHLLRMTRHAVFVPALGAWFDPTTGKQCVGERTFNAIVGAVGSQGLAALDRLLCFIIAKELQVCVTRIRAATEDYGDKFDAARADLLPTSGVPRKNGPRHYQEMQGHFVRLFEVLATSLHRIGRMQLMRRLLANELRSNAKLNSGTLFSSLTSVNQCLLADLDKHYANPLEHPMPTEVVAELTPYLHVAGLTNSASQVYITSKPLADLPLILMALVMRVGPQFHFADRLQCLAPAAPKKFTGDAVAFVAGVATMLKQFHTDSATLFLGLFTQAVRIEMCEHEHSIMEKRPAGKQTLPESALTMTRMIETYCDVTGEQLADLHGLIPAQLLSDTVTNP